MISFDRIKSLVLSNPIITVGVLGVSGIAIHALYKSYKNKQLKAKLKEKVFVEEQNALMQSNERTITDEKAESIANALYNAMKGVGTDEDLIEEILITRNRLTSPDLIAVNKAFGMREYGSYGAPAWGDGTFINLVGWFNEELNNTGALYNLLKTKFEQAGILWN